MWRVIVAVGLMLGMTVVTPQPVFACSCELMGAGEHLELVDAAFVGTLISREDETVLPDGTVFDGEEVTWTFRVEAAVKGEFGETVDVQAAIDGAACGFEAMEGTRMDVFLHERAGEWHSGSCSIADPDTLLRAIQPLPPPDGSGPVALLIGTRSGDARVMALDREGRTLAYGYGEGRIAALAVCPGSERFLEYVVNRDDRTAWLVVRDLRSFDVVDKIALPDAIVESVTMHCRDRAGGEAFLYQSSYVSGSAEGQLLHLRGGEVRSLFPSPVHAGSGAVSAFDVDNEIGYLSMGYRGREIVAFDLTSGDELWSVFVPGDAGDPGYIRSLALSPDGTRLAVTEIKPGPDATASVLLLTLDAMSDPTDTRELRLNEHPYAEGVIWLDNETFLVTGNDHPSGGSPAFNLSFEHVSSISELTVRSAVWLDDTIYGFSWTGDLLSAALPDGPVTTLRSFDDPNLHVLAGVPDEVELNPGAGQPPAPTASPTEPPTPVVDLEPSPTLPGSGSTPSATPTEAGTSMEGDFDFTGDGTGEGTPAGSVAPAWLFGAGILAVVAAGGWVLFRLLER